MYRNLPLSIIVFGLVMSGCGDTKDPAARDDTGEADASEDAGTGDAAADVDTDVTADANEDAEVDAVGDVAPDAPRDAVEDAIEDAPGDADPDAGTDAGDAGVDAIDADDADIGPDVGPSDGPVIVREGTTGYLVRGDLLLEDRVLTEGELLIVGDRITCVADSCADAEGAADATIIETNGIVSPGLIDAHNHVAYNFLPEWIPEDGRLFENRYEWADDPSYEEHVLPLTAYRSSNSHFCPAAQWGELRSLLHGTTTMQGQSFDRTCLDGLVRNADHDHGLGPDHMRTTIGSVRDINDEAAAGYADSFEEEVTRFAVHMQEGVAGRNLLEEFESFAGRDTRPNRHMGLSLLGGTSILIHSISLTREQLDEVADNGAHIVWSPSSNIVLYGDTLDIDEVIMRGIAVGLGPDWTPSGEDDMLAELSYADQYARDASIESVTPEVLWRMATSDGAFVVGLEDDIGRIEEGYAADIVVFSPRANPWRSVVEARAGDVQLVFIDGAPIYGLGTLDALVDGCESIDVCGDDRFICRPPSEYDTVGDIQQALIDILEGNGFPPEEQYGRGDELLPLVDCSR